jgi:phosphonate ABC transporter substrate-binding protein
VIASLPMYWRDETAPAWREFWATVRSAAAREGLDLPDLTPPDALPDDWGRHWLSSDLVLSQTCSLPYRTRLADHVKYVGTFDFGLDTPPGHYCSLIIARKMQVPDTPRLACNAPDSQSGWAVAFEHLGPRIGSKVMTGSHAASLAAVADGHADIAFVDAVTWRTLERYDPNAARVHVVGRTPSSPGLPLIAARGIDPAPLRAALTDATRALGTDDNADLGGLCGFEVLDESTYRTLPIPPTP